METDIFPKMLEELKDSIVDEMRARIIDDLQEPIRATITEIMREWRNNDIKNDIDDMGQVARKFTLSEVENVQQTVDK